MTAVINFLKLNNLIVCVENAVSVLKNTRASGASPSKKQKQKTQVILSALRPRLVIPRGLSTLYICSLTTMAQDKPYHEKPLIRDCCNHKGGGGCTLFRPYITIASGISSSSFIRVSTKQLAVSSLSKGISSTLNF